MARPKRAATQVDAIVLEPLAKKGRKEEKATHAVGRPNRTSAAEAPAPVTKKNGKEVPTTAAARRTRRAAVKEEEAPASAPKDAKRGVKSKASKAIKASGSSTLPKAPKESKASKAIKPASNSAPNTETSDVGKGPDTRRGSIISTEVPVANQGKKRGKEESNHEAGDDDEDEDASGISYWLMKAEPESRMEKGKDVKFSIDDLAARTEPEAWDGMSRDTHARSQTC